MLQFSAEHRRDSVKSCALLLRHCFESSQGVKIWSRYDSGGGFQDCCHVAHHHSEAMVERHRYANAIARCDPHALGHEQCVVDDVVMAQDRSLRMACRSDVYWMLIGSSKERPA